MERNVTSHPNGAPAPEAEGRSLGPMERLLRQAGLASSSHETVYAPAIEAHDHTVIPTARVWYAFGAGSGPELAGRIVERRPDGRVAPSLSSGGGGGGLAFARPAGYIEISSAGTRFVPVRRDWRGMATVVAVVVAAVALRSRRRP